ncbi:MAG: ATPase [Moraxellaceae bacterium]|nr:MAG: ATPase [Moraxellaceae bacterium]
MVARRSVACGIAVAALFLSGCDGHSSSGAENQQFPDTNELVAVVNYTGPAAATTDIQNFKLNVWDNLVTDDRCGRCHGVSGQSPQFVNQDDINLAYAAANTIVDLSNPGESRMVTKVAGGHNCWEASDTFCADVIQGYISNWAFGSSEVIDTAVQLVAPIDKPVSSSKNFPDDAASFGSTLYPLLTEYCAGCHSDSASVPQAPYFASSDLDIAYEAVQSKLDLETPSNSRLVVRLRDEFHNCWSDCSANSAELEAAITLFADGIETTEVDLNLVLSRALNLLDGIAAKKGVRYKANAIAVYEFKTGEGELAYDTSGIDPAMHLTLSGDVDWLGSWGLRVNDGKAQATTSASKKLNDLILATGEYSLEAWVAPANVVQEDARIVSYSGGTTVRNFTVGQTLYNYDFFNRSTTTDGNGNPALSTDDDAEVLQATLQHVVVTYDPANGRRIYVNAELTDAVDTFAGGNLSEWDDTFAFVLGNEVSSDRLWQGSIRYVAVHNRVLTDGQIEQNFQAGVGEIFYMLFNVSEHVDVPDAYVVFIVSQFDGGSYLFANPFFISLDSAQQPDGITIKGMRIGINGREALVGQAFTHLDFVVQQANYSIETGVSMITQYVPGVSDDEEFGAIIALEKGPESDEFFLSFEQLGDSSNVFVEASPIAADLSFLENTQPHIGVRTFEEISHTMSAMTGIAVTHPDIVETFIKVKQQLPTAADIEGFLASHQMAVTQMSIEYCNALVDDDGLRSSFFPGFSFNADPDVAFGGGGTAIVVNALIANMMGVGLSVQPDNSDIYDVLVNGDLGAGYNGLIDELNDCPIDCNAARTEIIVKASCAAVLGSAVMLIQ